MILVRENLLSILRQYSPERRYALAIFQDIQQTCGYLPKEHIIEAAQYLKIPLSQAYAMITFYHSFSLVPRGKYVIRICNGTTCHVKNTQSLLKTITQILGIDAGDTYADNLFTIEPVSCLGACAISPVMQINGEYYGNLTVEKIYEILAEFYRKELIET